ncbi:up-regulator of cell proliferation-like [Engraulis encrasicolus]|uniref:up-regulator of cell proliferation-like n=1 Tax=Engraulis encrasicolus TaxID=184585 RepID=UPI002FD79D73
MASGEEDMQNPGLAGDPPQQSHAAFLGKLGLLEFYPNRLTLKYLLEINHDTMSDKELLSLKDVPLAFLKKLLMVNTKCWNYTCTDSETTPNKDSDNDDDEEEEDNEYDGEEDMYSDDGKVNPLDLVTALYHCADSFLQQEMAIKMSMCQFAIPFLLPQFSESCCSLMLWALRNIYKEWRPRDQLNTKQYVEDSVVHAQIPVLSFVRLGNCSLSKSQLLNHVLSNAQHINVFTHRDMSGGNAPKKIANGLVEIAWCLPSGKSTIDVFPEPVAIANMRGEISSSDTQFSFLMKVSAAVFVFLDTMTDEERQLLDSQGSLKSKLFLVINTQRKGLQRKYTNALKLKEERVLRRERRLNMAESNTLITDAMKTALKECTEMSTLEEMSDIALNMGISVDENKVKASVSAKATAETIMKGIGNSPVEDYKKIQLPLQGDILKELAKTEIEACRLQNPGSLSLEEHKAQLHMKRQKLREHQRTIKISEAAGMFIQALSTVDKDERAFFLRWIALQLDRKSRKRTNRTPQRIPRSLHGK